ncbi:MAG: methyltransferase [Pseudomonadota bacterium]
MQRGFRGRLWAWRDRLLADPRIQNWAVALPFLRPIANRRARSIFDLCIGFVHTQVVTAVVELGVLDALAASPKTAAEIAGQTGLQLDPTERLLKAAVAINLLVRTSGDRYRLGELGAALRGAPGVVEIIRHNQVFYRDLSDPVALLKGDIKQTELSAYWPYAEGGEEVGSLDPEKTGAYTQLMAASQPFIADDVMAAFDFSKHKALLDVGGGDGTFAARIAGRHDALRVGTFDLGSVVRAAQSRFEREGLAARATAHAGDFHRDALPVGYDAISLVRILLDHDDASVARLLSAVRAALQPGGRVLIAELMSDARGAETITDAYFGLYLYAMGRGRPRSAARISDLLSEAGFKNPREVGTRRMLMTQLVVADAPDLHEN